MNLYYKISEIDNYKTLKDVLISYFNISHRLLVKIKNLNCIFLNNSLASVNQNVSTGDIVEIKFNYDEDNSNIVPSKMELDIIYEDEAYIVVNKPAGIPVHPSILHFEDSLSNGIKYYFDTINLKKKIRPVNRIDKDTSGIVIFAKNEYIQEALIRQMNSKEFVKEYLAIAEGFFCSKKRNYKFTYC